MYENGKPFSSFLSTFKQYNMFFKLGLSSLLIQIFKISLPDFLSMFGRMSSSSSTLSPSSSSSLSPSQKSMIKYKCVSLQTYTYPKGDIEQSPVDI